MADANSSAAVQVASLPIKAEILSMPGFGAANSTAEFDPSKYRVRYGKYLIGDPEGTAELEEIETKGLKGVDIVVLSKTTFTFMSEFSMVITYLERI